MANQTRILTGAGPHSFPSGIESIKAVGGDASFLAKANNDTLSSWSSDGSYTGTALSLQQDMCTTEGIQYTEVKDITGTIEIKLYA